jgi:dipeptidyl aminopeptidase/acylaminoacyl peptidase
MNSFSRFALPAVLLGMSVVVWSQDPNSNSSTSANAKRTLKPEDYKQWERISGASMTNDGRYLIYTISKVDADGFLLARKIDGPEKLMVPNANRASNSDSSKYFAYLSTVPRKEADRLNEQKQPVPSSLVIGKWESLGQQGISPIGVPDISGYQFLKNQDMILATRAKASPGPGGNDVLLINPGGGEPFVYSGVRNYVLNEQEDMMAAAFSTPTGYHYVQVINLKSGAINPIYGGKDEVGAMVWAKKSNTLAFAVSKNDETKEGNANRILRAYGFDSGSISVQDFDPMKRPELKGLRITEGNGLDISDDGTQIAFGLQPWRDRKRPTNPKDTPGVEIWNTKDTKVIPRQKLSARNDALRGSLHVWRAEKNQLVQVSPEEPKTDVFSDEISVVLTANFDYAIINDGRSYSSPIQTGINFRDVWVQDMSTMAKTKVLVKSQFPISLSETTNFFGYYQDQLWWVFNLKSGEKIPLRPKAKANFEDEEDDYTIKVKPPFASPIWLDNDERVVLHDFYDVYFADPKTGQTTKVTQGRKDQIQYRFQAVRDWQPAQKFEFPMYLSMLDKETKKTGISMVGPSMEVKPVILDDVSVRNIDLAKNADRVMFSMESFQNSANLYITNQIFSAIKPVTKTNPQQEQFLWGTTKVIPFKSRWGAQLHGTLFYPAGYDAKKKYPMVTYIYERLSDETNSYQYPSEWSAYNIQHLVQNGYFVYKPDIAYKGNRPGENAVDCLEPAVDAVLKMNVGVDPAKVGLIGHSWGAYQTAFVTTVSNRFSAAACGAPLTELTSMYNSFYWNSGTQNQVIFESSQGRTAVPFWEDPKAYFDNSPVWQASKRKIPLLMAFGDKDGAVDWHQGQYLYNTLRRMGKECTLLLYAGENHNFTNRPNQLDYARRLRHWLDVYLKGEKPEDWVKNGVPYIRQ